ncbi:MAG: phospholipase A [Bdellovibrionota bacterium]
MRALMLLALLALLPQIAVAYVDEGTPPVVKLSAYKPSYTVVGKNDGKIQLSFKARPASAFALYFGYTQLMMWDIYKSSAPMRDVNFNPEVFYRFTLGDKEELRWIDFGPFEHESNGFDGANSRSWNRTYLRYSDTLFTDGPRKLQWSVKLWVPYSCEGGFCTRYRGVGEGTASIDNLFGTAIGENDLTLRFYPGGPSALNLAKGGQELTFRLRPVRRAFMPLFVVQFFHGYGENLLDQAREGLALRGGIGF